MFVPQRPPPPTKRLGGVGAGPAGLATGLRRVLLAEPRIASISWSWAVGWEADQIKFLGRRAGSMVVVHQELQRPLRQQAASFGLTPRGRAASEGFCLRRPQGDRRILTVVSPIPVARALNEVCSATEPHL